MKIIAISDTHMKHRAIESKLIELYNKDNNLILIHSGDACYEGTKQEGEEFLRWFGNLPFAVKIFVPGNHDIAFEHSYYRFDYMEMNSLAKELGISIIQNNIFEINGCKILGNSLIPNLENWAFFAEPGQRERFFEYIDQDVDIIISHTPPYGVGDLAPRGHGMFEHVGCKYLRNYIERNNTKIVINGHIHEGYGEHGYKNTKVYNVSILDGHYMSFNPITIIELEE